MSNARSRPEIRHALIAKSILWLCLRAVLMEVPLAALSSLLQHSHPELANKLDTIASVTVAVVCLEYEGTDLLPTEVSFISEYQHIWDIKLG